MGSKLIELKDDILVEIEVPDKQAKAISGGAASRVEASIESIKPILLTACRPIVSVWKELNKDLEVDSAEVTLNLGFSAEGNLFITKAKGSANISVKLVMKPKPNLGDGNDDQATE